LAELIYAITASLDGYIADENGNFDWGTPSEDAHLFFNDLQRSVGTVLSGRRMYETMQVWETLPLAELPAVEREFGELWRDTDKVVYSATLTEVSHPRTRLERVFDPAAIQAMKAAASRDLAIAGANLAAAAIRAGLVDRYQLRIAPTMVGAGTRALPDGVSVNLALVAERRFTDGTVLLDYRTR
jgi:dihydrofolate reductase